MKRVAIIGGGISGLAAAYELEKQRKGGAELDWHLYEASSRLGGTVESTIKDGFIIEGGPDGWVTEKPWARDLAIDLGLENQLIYSNDATRKTYIYIDGALQAMPDRMRMMVPEDLSTLADSPLFSRSARDAYAAEVGRASELCASAPIPDESVASFVRRHFGEEVLSKIGAPLLSGVFGGDVEKLSVQAVMPAFVAMEREHGSLITAVQSKAAARGGKPPQPIFTTLRDGLGSLVAGIVATLPAERLHLNRPASSIKREGKLWALRTLTASAKGHVGKSKRHFHHILLATPAAATRTLLQPTTEEAGGLIPVSASSAVLVAFAWPAEIATTFAVPQGFGFLVPQAANDGSAGPRLLAATFVDQKFPHRTPPGARLVRVFFGGRSTEAFADTPDAQVAAEALTQLQAILGPLPAPDPTVTSVTRWPDSLPQYEVGHLERLDRLNNLIAQHPGLFLLGNSYRGVGLPDLIRDARNVALSLSQK